MLRQLFGIIALVAAGVLMGAGYMAVTAPVCPACGCQGAAPKA